MTLTSSESLRQLRTFYAASAGAMCLAACPAAVVVAFNSDGAGIALWLVVASLLGFAGPYYIWKASRRHAAKIGPGLCRKRF